MDLTDMTFEERIGMMRRRHGYFSSLSAKGFFNLSYIDSTDEYLAIRGIELNCHDNYYSLYIQLSPTDYEEYYILCNLEGNVSISPVVAWQDDRCANSYIDIFTGMRSDFESIFA